MTTFDQFLTESINDKGLFKAIFICGISGAGKSYTLERLKGSIAPRVVNTDNALEFLIKKEKVEANGETWKTLYSDRTKRITKGRLQAYLDGMLPLFIDGTSNDPSNIMTRVGILKGLGYDVGMVFVNVDVDVAIERVNKRNENGRIVPVELIKKVYADSEEAKEHFKSEFPYFVEINNNDDMDDELFLEIFRKVQGFYEKPLNNFVGKKTLKKLKDAKSAYLCPTIIEKETLKRKVDIWYKR